MSAATNHASIFVRTRLRGPIGAKLFLAAVLLLAPPALLASNTPALCFRNVEIGETIPECKVMVDDKERLLGDLCSDQVSVLLFLRATRQEWKDALRDTEWACSGHSRPFKSLAILAEKASIDEVTSFVESEGVQMEMLREVDCFSSFGVVTSPTVAIVDKTGKLVYAHPGYRRAMGDSLRVNLEKALAGKLVVKAKVKGTDAFYRALKLKGEGKVREALPLFQQAAEEKPDFVDGRYHYGLLLLETGRFREGVAELEAVISMDPSHKNAFERLGDAYFHLGELDKAEAALKTCFDLCPRCLLARAILAGVYVEKGMIDAALPHAEAALALNPKLPLGHYWLGRIYEAQGNTDDAIAEYQKALKSILEEER